MEEVGKALDSVESMIKGVFPQLLNSKDGKVGLVKKCAHEIHLKAGTIPVKHGGMCVPIDLRDELNASIDSMLARRIILSSTSEWTAQLVLVRKKNGSLRVCVDYRDLNNATMKDVYPIPNIDDLIYRLHQLEIATTFDLAEGYNKVNLLKAHKQLCAYPTDCGFFEPNVMTIGLTNGPAKFERMMNEVIGKEIDKYVLISSISRKEHFREVDLVCFRLTATRVKLKWEKCMVEQLEV